MPKIRRTSTRPPPSGFELIEPTLLDLEQKMREAETSISSNARRDEMVWNVFRVHHQRSRYIFDLYRSKVIDKVLYDWCVKQKYVDVNLVAKWKKPGYESLCCTRCIQTKDTNYGTTCICRVPRNQLEEGKVVECVHCGCRGCGGSGEKKEKEKEVIEKEVAAADEVAAEDCEYET